MTPFEPQDQPPPRNRTLVFVVGVAGVMLCVIMAAAGYFIGRATAPSDAAVNNRQEQAVETPIVASGDAAGENDDNDPIGENEETNAGSPATEGDTPRENNPSTENESATGDTQPENEIATPRTEDIEEIDFQVFYEAWEIVEGQFDGELPLNEEILYTAIEGSLKNLGDDYTRFVRPEAAARMREDAGGSVEGIGAFVRENDEGFFEIVRPIPGQPAEIAGLLPNDIVVAVDGESVLDLTFDEVILMVRGPRGTDVTLTIEREGEEGEAESLEFTITRVSFEIPTVEYELLADGIGYIHLQEFNRTAEEKVLAALADLLAQDAESIIFDLRDNPGGFLDQSVAVADIFLAESVVLFERNQNGLDRTFTVDDGDGGETIPMVVLINAGSASASEIVAGAIRDNGRAILIGETTFGKGSVQQVHALSDGSEIRVTIARWYTPSNNSIDETGITPDIEVPMEFDAEEDVQLERAIEYLLNGQ